MRNSLFLSLLSSLMLVACTSAQGQSVDLYGVRLGMSQSDAIEVMQSRKLFESTSWDGTIVVGTDMECLDDNFPSSVSKRPCKHLRLDSAQFSKNSEERDWLVAEVSLDQAFKDPIPRDAWLSRIADEFGTNAYKADTENSPRYSTESYYFVLAGSLSRLDAVEAAAPSFDDLVDELVKAGCGEQLQVASAMALRDKERVYAYQLELVDLRLKCKEREAAAKWRAQKAKEKADQIELR